MRMPLQLNVEKKKDQMHMLYEVVSDKSRRLIITAGLGFRVEGLGFRFEGLHSKGWAVLTAGGNAGDKSAPVWTSRLVYYQQSDWGLGAMQVLYLSTSAVCMFAGGHASVHPFLVLLPRLVSGPCASGP